MGWILNLFVSRHIFPYIKWCAGIIINRAATDFNLQMVPLHLESWTSQKQHPVRWVRAHVLTIQVYHRATSIDWTSYMPVFKWEQAFPWSPIMRTLWMSLALDQAHAKRLYKYGACAYTQFWAWPQKSRFVRIRKWIFTKSVNAHSCPQYTANIIKFFSTWKY